MELSIAGGGARLAEEGLGDSVEMRLPYALLFALPLAAACGTPDPTQFRPGFGERVTSGGDGDASMGGGAGDDASSMTPPPGNDAGAPPHDGGTGATDAPSEGASDAAMLVDAGTNAFTGAPPYAPTTGPSTLNASHNFPNATPTTNPAGQACMTCHGAAGPGGEFRIGGTVWKDTAGTLPAPQVQVGVRDKAGVVFDAYTDANGNFYVPKLDAGTLTSPAYSGVRNAQSTRFMVGAINNGNCNGCHRTGGQTPLNL